MELRWFILFIVFIKCACGTWLDYVTNYFDKSNDEKRSSIQYLENKIPYEVSSVEEKFLQEAAHLTGVALSDLDSCQQRVVVRLKSDCHKLNDDQLAKMAVALLNCQSFVEGRPLYPCTEDMSLKQCTKDMDSDTWTTYHLMSNRARSVCYSIRQTQFRGLAEMTINRLMDASQLQLKTLSDIEQNQNNIKTIADETYGALFKSHEKLLYQQERIQKSNERGLLTVDSNIKKLIEEKELISHTFGQLTQMVNTMNTRLSDYSDQMKNQANDTLRTYKFILEDIEHIQEKTRDIFTKIDEYSGLLIDQNENFRLQYKNTMLHMLEMNRTVENLMEIINGTNKMLEERFDWIINALGGADVALQHLYVIVWHTLFIVVAMITCSFLSLSILPRVVVAVVPPLNLFASLSEWEMGYLNPLELTLGIISSVLLHSLSIWMLNYRQSHTTSAPPLRLQNYEINNDSGLSLDNLRENVVNPIDLDNITTYTPPLSSRNSSRGFTPVDLERTMRQKCNSLTKTGGYCKLTPVPGMRFCHKHRQSSSTLRTEYSTTSNW